MNVVLLSKKYLFRLAASTSSLSHELSRMIRDAKVGPDRKFSTGCWLSQDMGGWEMCGYVGRWVAKQGDGRLSREMGG
jgi:hypothetical protein